ncbi:hypothetical protein SAMN05421666_3076 [Roseovarius nanhaiticus]|uniref:Cold shock protein, CspA family n=1 Tax=Roseovarius nanhaiticus TaxID=573024 RepID=A0A1N7HHG4_9RHOB|nr:hypothetical protein [Roseovarius nanhaiticus]SEK93930.1 hypothetical protein SAMN05216208_2240 [Roseovarius nanhaiticus]SIS24316.1 hypothetical protein SAMN05421666_3076 [Roseovarius nanhaiticus]
MYGVVLWTDQRQNRAVIWCEDHGDLAFYRGAEGGDAAMAAGDLVEFDLRDTGEMRLADTPRLITQRSHPTLCTELKKAGAKLGVLKASPRRAANSDHAANVIRFHDARVAAYA